MKSLSKTKGTLFFLLFAILIGFIPEKGYSQKDKKSLSLAIQYFKIMKEYSYLSINAKYKGENGFEPSGNLLFTIYKTDTIDASKAIKIGQIKTNKDGKAKFIIPPTYVNAFNAYAVRLENNKTFEDTEESLNITDVSIEASLVKSDSIYNIRAQLRSASKEPIAEEPLKAGLKRLFGNLAIGGEDSFTTDSVGTILVPIEKGLTGINGKLNFQVILEESEKSGTVIANVNTGFGVPIVDKSSFKERTMWSPPTKTPYFLLIIPNILLVGIWSILVLLVLNLFKIYKSKIY